MTFRFDDVSVNTDISKLMKLITTIRQYQPDSRIILSISPIVFEEIGERVHPSRFTALSTLHPYYEGTRCGIPDIPPMSNLEFAGHGLMHVDHRLLGRKSQEMSIVGSCSLADADIFCPPYNKYNDDTEDICQYHGIYLIRFDDGWEHVLYNSYDIGHELYYLHPFDMTPNQLAAWFSR